MILVTGGAGFIGSHVAGALLDDGHDVRILDSLLPAAHRGGAPHVDPRAEFIHGDVGDPDALRDALQNVTSISHQAAMVGLGSDFADVADYVRENDLATAVLLRALATGGFRGRLVLASSMVVYGEGAYRCADHGPLAAPPREPGDLAAGRFDPLCPRCDAPLHPMAVGESARLDPRNVYAATKVHQEHLCFAFARECQVPVVALRYHNVYGPRMPRDTPYAGVASIFRSALAAGRPPRVFEDGRQLRDFIHVRDIARANVIALTADAVPTAAFNVASGRPRSVGEMAGALARESVGPGLDPVTTGEYRLGDVRHVFASPDRAAAELGFAAVEDFDLGMREFARAPLRGVPADG
ncbi:MAG TPA: NAD-dependent epimerase/dehydratase family protein [Solirubrobacteraceae bacterium]|nr:NAD-dependent epimerase/dehydratase family protein [Solirubrobacteraceae bacterium]